VLRLSYVHTSIPSRPHTVCRRSMDGLWTVWRIFFWTDIPQTRIFWVVHRRSTDGPQASTFMEDKMEKYGTCPRTSCTYKQTRAIPVQTEGQRPFDRLLENRRSVVRAEQSANCLRTVRRQFVDTYSPASQTVCGPSADSLARWCVRSFTRI